jgi:hypothetical protein
MAATVATQSAADRAGGFESWEAGRDKNHPRLAGAASGRSRNALATGASNIHPASRHVAACPRARTDHDQELASFSSMAAKR